MIDEVQDASGKPIIFWTGFDAAIGSKAKRRARAAYIAAASPEVVRGLIDRLRALEGNK